MCGGLGKGVGLLRLLRMLRILFLSTVVRGVRGKTRGFKKAQRRSKVSLGYSGPIKAYPGVTPIGNIYPGTLFSPCLNQESQLSHLTELNVTRSQHSGQYCQNKFEYL